MATTKRSKDKDLTITEETSPEETSPEAKPFPSLKFLVDDSDVVEVPITICAIEDENGNYRPRPVRRNLLEAQKETLTTRLNAANEQLYSLPEDNHKRIELSGESIALTSVLSDIDAILDAPYKTYVSKWKRTTWRDLAQLNTDSYIDGPAGTPVWSEERFRDAKVRLLLKEWDLTETNINGREVKIPVSRAHQVDGVVVQAFIEEYDRLLSLTNKQAKN